MGGLLRKLAIYLCAPIYKLIPQIYQIFYMLANHRFLEDDTIQSISTNIYVLISVIMLFAFSANILAAIVNPDLLTDKKKGVGAMFKRAIIGLVLIVIMPFAFDKAYEIQTDVISRNLIEKVIIGINYTNDGGGTNGGQVIAGQLISAVLHPVEDEVEISEDVSSYYESMVKTDIKDIDLVKFHINVVKGGGTNEKMFTDSENYAFTFDGLIAILAGGVCCYLLIMFSIDMAVRIFKLAFLELTSPIIVVSYIATGDSILKKWAKEVGTTFVDVFVRIACMAFFIFLVYYMDGFLNRVVETAKESNLENFGIIDTFFLRVLLIIGMLIFVKQIPDFVNKVFGTNLQSKGGISGRLGEMAVGAKLAQSAWNGIKNTALLGMGASALALPAGIGLAAGYGLHKATGGKSTDALRKGAKAVGNVGRTVYNAASPVVKTLTSANPIKGFSESGVGQSLKYQREQTEQQRIKDNAKTEAQETAKRKYSDIYDANGDLKKGIAQGAEFEVILKASNLNDFEKTIVQKFDDTRHAKRLAENDQYHYDSISKMISNSIAASSNSAEKQELLNLQSKIDSGTISADDIEAKLGQMSSMTDPSGELNATAESIIKSAKIIAGGNSAKNITSKVEIEDKLDSTTRKFNTAETEFNNMVDKMDDKKKAQTKAYAKVGDDISKSKIQK